jgi:hypothetical protein
MRRSRVKTEQEWKRKDTVGWTDGTKIASVGAIVGRVGSLGKTLGTVGWTDGPISRCVGRVAEEEQRRSSTGWSDEDTVGLSDAKFESWQRCAKTKPSAPNDLTTWSRGSVGLSDGRVEANRVDLDAGSSAPDEPTHRRCIASGQLCQRISTAKWRGRGIRWTDTLKKTTLVHPTLPFSVVVSQRLVWCLGVFIPPPLTHLR